MLKPLLRGRANTKQEDDLSSPSSSPKKSKGEKSSKNPYAAVGRDKFATVVADLDKKRRTIYEQVGTQDISKVRFGYSDSKKWVPIVVRSSKEQIEDKLKLLQSKDKHVTHITEVSNKSQTTQKVEKQVEQPKADVDGKTRREAFYGGVNYLWKWIQPCYDFPLVLVLVLSCLGWYGRLLAISCSFVWWVLVRRMKSKEGSLKEVMKKKEGERKLSEKKMDNFGGSASPRTQQLPPIFSSPKTVLSHGSSPRHHHAYH